MVLTCPIRSRWAGWLCGTGRRRPWWGWRRHSERHIQSDHSCALHLISLQCCTGVHNQVGQGVVCDDFVGDRHSDAQAFVTLKIFWQNIVALSIN